MDADWDILSKELIARCHAAGICVFAGALGKSERIEAYRQAIDWGIDVIPTDHPLRVLRAIELSLVQKPETSSSSVPDRSATQQNPSSRPSLQTP